MTILCDFSVIQQDEVRIGYGETSDVERRSFRAAFGTAGRHAQGGALLILSVKGLTRTGADPQVKINDHEIGVIHRYTPSGNPQFPENTNHWFTQTIAFDAHFLKKEAEAGGANVLEITSVPTMWSGEEETREDFRIKNVICFFHQEA
jgi:hypothetical protein